MQHSDRRFDTDTMRTLFDKGSTYWATLAAHPAIAAALAHFPSERDTRRTGRLDLVAWIHVISAFGVDGPPDTHWDQLFTACCFEAPHPSPHDNLPYLREHHVAVLLAYAKVTHDIPENTSHTHLIKQRIRPAVIGRPEARAPGILQHVQRKFDAFAYAFVSNGLVLDRIINSKPDVALAALLPPPDLAVAHHRCATSSCSSDPSHNQQRSFQLRLQQQQPHPRNIHNLPHPCTSDRNDNLAWTFDEGEHSFSHGKHDDTSPPYDLILDHCNDHPDVLYPVTPENSSPSAHTQAPRTRNTAEIVRDLARSHALVELKQWEIVMIDFLNLDTAVDPTANARYINFQRERESVRVQLQEGLCSMFSLYLCKQLEAASSRIPHDQSHRFYRRLSAPGTHLYTSMLSTSLLCQSEWLQAQQPAPQSYHIFRPFADTMYKQQTRMTSELLSMVSVANSVLARVTVMELHAPSAFGSAHVQFVPESCLDVAIGEVATLCSPTDTRSTCSAKNPICDRATFCLLDPTSASSLIKVPGTSCAGRCSALQLIVEVNVLPLDKSSSTRKFRYATIKRYEWITLGAYGTHDRCREVEPNDSDTDDISVATGAPVWLRSQNVAWSLAHASGVRCTVSEMCDKVATLPIQIHVPQTMLSRVDKLANFPSWARSGDGADMAADLNAYLDGVADDVNSLDASNDVFVFDETIRLDCYAVARFAYNAPGGIEIGADQAAGPSPFSSSPVWKWRRL